MKTTKDYILFIEVKMTNIETLKWLSQMKWEKTPEEINNEKLRNELINAIKLRDLNEIERLYLTGKYDLMKKDEYFSSTAASIGDLNILKSLLQKGFKFTSSTFNNAVAFGDQENLEWLLENDCKFDLYTFSIAARNGNLTIMKWLLEKKCYVMYAMLSAAEFGDIDNMNWLFDNGCSIYFEDYDDMYRIFSNCKIEVIKWMLEKRSYWEAYDGYKEDLLDELIDYLVTRK